MRYRIATWTPRDGEEVLAFILGIQRGEFGLGITAADQPDLSDVTASYQAGGGEFWVARHEGTVVGTIAAIAIGGDEIALRKMFVAGAHRGRAGLAHALMARLQGWARRRGVRTIYLGTTAVMSAAHRFYERQGFAAIDASDLPASFPRMEVDSRFYRRELESAPG